jgi:plastocyanin
MRRCVTVLAIGLSAALVGAGAAAARTKVVVAGGPPPKASLAGHVKFAKDLDLNGFFRRKITVHVGDSVRWLFSKRVVHTVTFLARGQAVPTLEQANPANPYRGFNDANGAPFWWNGQPSLEIPGDHAFPTGGGSTDGSGYRNSGLSAATTPAFKPYKLRFTKAGTFKYYCLVHPGMVGTVKVVRKGRAIPSARADRAARNREFKRAVKRAKQLGKFNPGANNVVAGHDAGTVAWFRFFPRTRVISAGQTVHFSISSKSEIHTVLFGPAALRDTIRNSLILGPPPLRFNPLTFLPSDPALPPYTGTNHGNGYLNTGVLDTNPASPPPSSADVTFTTPGTYAFECTIHPGMQATITVT